MRTLRVVTISEDFRFQLFLERAIQKIGRIHEVQLQLQASVVTNGCRVQVLLERFERLRRECDVLVVGADSKHGGRRQTYKKKASLMRKTLLGRDIVQGSVTVLAVADPSVEAWLLSDPTAFADGLASVLATEFVMPKHWPSPHTEHEAKRELGRVVREGVGANLPMGGFEFAEDIVARMELAGSSSHSLSAWAKEMAHAFRAPPD